MAEEDVQEGAGLIPPRWKAFLASLAVDLVFIPVIFVMLYFWPVFIMTIAPYLGGYAGGRYTDPRNGFVTGGLAGVVMMTVLVVIILRILMNIQGLGEGFDPFEPIGLSLVATGYVLSFVFGALGGRHGARSVLD